MPNNSLDRKLFDVLNKGLTAPEKDAQVRALIVQGANPIVGYELHDDKSRVCGSFHLFVKLGSTRLSKLLINYAYTHGVKVDLSRKMHIPHHANMSILQYIGLHGEKGTLDLWREYAEKTGQIKELSDELNYDIICPTKDGVGTPLFYGAALVRTLSPISLIAAFKSDDLRSEIKPVVYPFLQAWQMSDDPSSLPKVDLEFTYKWSGFLGNLDFVLKNGMNPRGLCGSRDFRTLVAELDAVTKDISKFGRLKELVMFQDVEIISEPFYMDTKNGPRVAFKARFLNYKGLCPIEINVVADFTDTLALVDKHIARLDKEAEEARIRRAAGQPDIDALKARLDDQPAEVLKRAQDSFADNASALDCFNTLQEGIYYKLVASKLIALTGDFVIKTKTQAAAVAKGLAVTFSTLAQESNLPGLTLAAAVSSYMVNETTMAHAIGQHRGAAKASRGMDLVKLSTHIATMMTAYAQAAFGDFIPVKAVNAMLTKAQTHIGGIKGKKCHFAELALNATNHALEGLPAPKATKVVAVTPERPGSSSSSGSSHGVLGFSPAAKKLSGSGDSSPALSSGSSNGIVPHCDLGGSDDSMTRRQRKGMSLFACFGM